MATAPSPASRSRRPVQPAATPPRWRRWLVLGLAFGLGHGLTQRLLDVNWEEGSRRPPVFRGASPPGTSLEELRRQSGDKDKPLLTDLEALSREKQEAKENVEAAKREAAERQKASLQEEKDRLDSERQRLQEIENTPEIPADEPAGPRGTPPATPTAPELPPPVPSDVEAPAPPPSQTPAGGAPSPP